MDKFLKNCWYMAGWSHEVEGDALFRRKLLGEPVLFFRKTDGTLSSMLDRCPHRFAPLSKGQRDGDMVICPYHGLGFDAGGKCIHNPYSDTIPGGTNIDTFVTAERDGIIWFWPGDGAKADLDLIPDFSILFVEGHGAPLMSMLPMAANYQMGTDNLLDLSHIEFVHKGSFAGNGVIFSGEHSVVEEGNELWSNWWMPKVAAPPHTMGIYDPEMLTDHWLDMRWEAPAAMYLQVGACPHGEDRNANPILAHQAHIITPEDEENSHYFWATTRGMPPSEEGDAMMRGLMEQAFVEEDKPIIEATFANMQGRDFWNMKPAFLGIDQGGTRARRKLEEMIAAERSLDG